MPNLIDDPRYYQKLLDFLDILTEEQTKYQQAMADEAAKRATLLQGIPSDDEIRAAYSDWPQVQLDAGLRLVRNVLTRSGKLHLLLRLSEFDPATFIPGGPLAALAASAREGELEYYQQVTAAPETITEARSHGVE